MKKNKAAFFDRDGTLIKDVRYLSNLNQVELIPGIINFCLDLQKKDIQAGKSAGCQSFFIHDVLK